MKILINYATPRFVAARDLNSVTGMLVGGFDKVIEYSPEDLDATFRQRNAPILNQARGGGYWLWKPYLIRKTLNAMHADDFLFYSDVSGCFTGSVAPLIDVMRQTDEDVIAFKLRRQPERMWTKRDAFVLMDCDTARYTDTVQVEAGFSLWRKTPASVALAGEWLRYAQDERIISDMSNRCGRDNYPEFREHRHDQSIWSLLCKKHRVALHRQPWRPADAEFPDSAYPRFIACRRRYPRALLAFCATHPMQWRLTAPVLRTLILRHGTRLLDRVRRRLRSFERT